MLPRRKFALPPPAGRPACIFRRSDAGRLSCGGGGDRSKIANLDRPLGLNRSLFPVEKDSHPFRHLGQICAVFFIPLVSSVAVLSSELPSCFISCYGNKMFGEIKCPDGGRWVQRGVKFCSSRAKGGRRRERKACNFPSDD